MKHHPAKSRRLAAFTLIEMLVVIGIIALLATIAVPTGNMVLQKARALQAKTAMKGVEIAINAYKTEYGRLPLASGNTGEQTYNLNDADGLDLLKALMADVSDTTNNPRQIKFYDPPSAKGSKNGYIENSGLVDPWGTGFVLIINYDHETTPMENPYAGDSGEPDVLNSTAILYSFGPDKIQGNKDDVKSW